MKRITVFIILFLGLTISSRSQGTTLVLGNPSGATADTRNPDNYLVNHSGFVLSYNKTRGAPNWVTWHLSASDIGDTDRADFIPDPLLPPEWRVKKADYTGSGLDRGHMCPSKDRSDTVANNKECFVMSNIEPQTKRLNEVTWKNLEDHTRDVVKEGNEAYIYAGCYGSKGRIKGKVTIPTRCFKIVIILPEGTKDLQRITVSTRLIIVDMPNTDNTSSDWKIYQKKTSIDKIEVATHFDFLSRVPVQVQRVLERKQTDEQ